MQRPHKTIFWCILAGLILVLAAVPALAQQVTVTPTPPGTENKVATPAPPGIAAPTGPDRTTLPLPEPQYPHSTVLDVRNAPPPPPRFEVKAPAGAPNVLIVLIDDMGFGQSGSFGGPINMPTVERLGQEWSPV